MGFYAIVALAFALSADAFSFSLGLGMAGVNRRQIILISMTVLIFHIIMPLIGSFVGGVFGTVLGQQATLIGALVLIFLGFRMIWAGLNNREEKLSRYILTSTYGIILLGATVSLDALSVGFSLGTQKVALGLPVVVIGVIAGAMTFLGLGFGKRIGDWIGHRAVMVGGSILVYLGINLLK